MLTSLARTRASRSGYVLQSWCKSSVSINGGVSLSNLTLQRPRRIHVCNSCVQKSAISKNRSITNGYNFSQRRNFQPRRWVQSLFQNNNGKADFIINVKTGDQLHAGTDAVVRIILHSEDGNQTDAIKLDYPFRDDFERGQLDEFKLNGVKDVKDVAKIEIFRAKGPIASDWFVDYIEIEGVESGKRHFFPIFRWIKPDRRYVIYEMDNFLPQFDPEPENRELELKEKKETYITTMKVPGGPAQFASCYRWQRGCW